MKTLLDLCSIAGLIAFEARLSVGQKLFAFTFAIPSSASSGADIAHFTSYRPQSSDISEDLIRSCYGGGV